MKPRFLTLLCASLFTAALALVACAPGGSPAVKQASPVPPEVKNFAAEKERQARDLAKKLNVEMPRDFWACFDASKQGNWPTVSLLNEQLRERCGQYERKPGIKPDPALCTPVWQPLLETQIAVQHFALGETQYAFAFGRDIIASIPAGSIYFGGTDAGRGLVTALCRSHERADPFFVLTQSLLPDTNYLSYLRLMYGDRIYTPTLDDLEKAFSEYLADAQRRLEHDRQAPNEPRQIKPGEDVRMVDNRVQVSGQMARIAIKALLTKVIFDKNPDREFFIEESFPLDWMYPHLSPHGLILKVNRESLVSLSPEVVAQDREYWGKQLKPMLGDWLTPETSVERVFDFAEKVYVQKDLAGFTGDPKFVQNEYASKTYSKLRSSIAGLYNWRFVDASAKLRTMQVKLPTEQQAGSPEIQRLTAEQLQMQTAADFAFRQAFALCPRSPEAIFRYVSLLVNVGRVADALLIAEVGAKIDPSNRQLETLINELKRIKATQR